MAGIDVDTIKRTLAAKGIQPGETHAWQCIKYFWADQIYSKTEIVFAKYLLLPMSLNEWKDFLLLDEQFSTEIIEETYYSLHNDLCWNLYLVCILSDEDYEHTDLHARFELERNTNYVRKMILKESEIGERLPVGYTLFRANDQPLIQPEQEWREILKEEYDFCLKEFESTKFEEIATSISSRKRSVSIIFSTRTEKVSSVQSIHIPEMFRPHFFNRDVNLLFSKVNLLSGSNGAGKTSVLSAIELAMTGTVRKQHPVLNDPAEQADVSLTLRESNGEIEVHKSSNPQEKMHREVRWYKSRLENRTTEQLNVLFHRFNFFSVDDTYLFTSEQPDHGDIFSKLLYGPETTTEWKNIKVWREKCEQKIYQLRAEMKRLKELLRKPSPTEFINESSLRSYIEHSGLNLKPDAPYSQILEILAGIQAELNQVETYKPILSRAMLATAKHNTEQQLLDAHKRVHTLQEEFRRCSKDYENLKREIGKNETHLKYILQRKENLSALEKWLPALEIEIAHHEEFQAFRDKQQGLKEIDNNFSQLQEFWYKYHELPTLAERPDLDVQWAELEEKDAILRKQSAEIEALINETEIHAKLEKNVKRTSSYWQTICSGSTILEPMSALWYRKYLRRNDPESFKSEAGKFFCKVKFALSRETKT